MRAHITTALATLFLSGPACAANLIGNPSFEKPVVPVGNLTRFSTGSTIGPWLVVGASGTVDLISTSFTFDGFTFEAKKGQQWLDLTGNSQTATGVAQTFPTTQGSPYTLTFYVGSVYDTGGEVGTSSTVIVLNGSTQILSATAKGRKGTTTQRWQKFSVKFTATAAKTTLSFINGDPANDTDCGLDDVTVTPAS